jgi:hypothetical protein
MEMRKAVDPDTGKKNHWNFYSKKNVLRHVKFCILQNPFALLYAFCTGISGSQSLYKLDTVALLVFGFQYLFQLKIQMLFRSN